MFFLQPNIHWLQKILIWLTRKIDHWPGIPLSTMKFILELPGRYLGEHLREDCSTDSLQGVNHTDVEQQSRIVNFGVLGLPLS